MCLSDMSSGRLKGSGKQKERERKIFTRKALAEFFKEKKRVGGRKEARKPSKEASVTVWTPTDRVKMSMVRCTMGEGATWLSSKLPGGEATGKNKD